MLFLPQFLIHVDFGTYITLQIVMPQKVRVFGKYYAKKSSYYGVYVILNCVWYVVNIPELGSPSVKCIYFYR